MLRLGILLTRGLVPAALCTLVLAACGSHGATTAGTTAVRSTGTTPSGTGASARDAHMLYIFSSLPRSGPQKAESLQIEQGIRFGLAQADDRVGAYRIEYQARSDSLRPRPKHGKAAATSNRGWNATATVQNAEAAARNPRTVAYIGDLNSGATELSLPILNQAGIAQITPGSGYPGLTDSVPGVTLSGEPDKYYPEGRPSLLRLVPNDVVEAAAAVSWLKKYPTCHSLAAASFDGDAESAALVNAAKETAKLYKLTFVAASPGSNPKTYESYAHLLAQHGVDCFMLTGRVTRAAVTFTNYLKAQLPVGSVIVGSDGFCNPRWSDQADGGVAATVAGSLYCMTPVSSLAHYLGGKRFSALYQRLQGDVPTIYTYYGYLATRLILKAISEPVADTADYRKRVMYNLVNNFASVELQTYSFDPDGDLQSPTANIYQLDKMVDGKPRPDKVLNPSPLLTSAS